MSLLQLLNHADGSAHRQDDAAGEEDEGGDQQAEGDEVDDGQFDVGQDDLLIHLGRGLIKLLVDRGGKGLEVLLQELRELVQLAVGRADLLPGIALLDQGDDLVGGSGVIGDLPLDAAGQLLLLVGIGNPVEEAGFLLQEIEIVFDLSRLLTGELPLQAAGDDLQHPERDVQLCLHHRLQATELIITFLDDLEGVLGIQVGHCRPGRRGR